MAPLLGDSGKSVCLLCAPICGCKQVHVRRLPHSWGARLCPCRRLRPPSSNTPSPAGWAALGHAAAKPLPAGPATRMARGALLLPPCCARSRPLQEALTPSAPSRLHLAPQYLGGCVITRGGFGDVTDPKQVRGRWGSRKTLRPPTPGPHQVHPLPPLRGRGLWV